MDQDQLDANRRRFIAYFSGAGIGAALMPGALAAVAQDAKTVTIEMVEAAQAIAGLSFTRDELQRIVDRLNQDNGYVAGFAALRAANLDNSVMPAIVFNPVPPGKRLPAERLPFKRTELNVSMPSSDEELAFLPLTHLSKLVETRQVKPSDLTKLYLARLEQHDPKLHCVISLTEELALSQARRADEEIAAGRYRGPLHGIPWGVKDLMAVRGTKTTWGASPYRDQVIDVDSTVFMRLSEAGAILVAKLSTGALAITAQWFGGLTRNPWNTNQDAAGSSAGPGSATAAGLVGFSVGTDTGGSVIGPSTRNGITGLRPTFGRVSRHGVMALAWSQDTVGPMCRSAEDCALVFNAMYGPDGKDNAVLDVPFNWDATADVRKLRVGYLGSVVEEDARLNRTNPGLAAQQRRNNEDALNVIRSLGIELVPFDFPNVPIEAIDFIRYAETAAAFDDLTRTNKLAMLEAPPEKSPRPMEIRSGWFIPAPYYIQANRFRMQVMEKMDEAMSGLDLFVGSNQSLTNRTGHPALSVPNGFFQGSPTGLHFTGKLFGESELLLLANAFQARTKHHLQHPKL
jgi:Asp-tRNA(Asn)/Glu-tRNA(Gln) amidotransferase A subunit family amidase